MLTVHSLVTGLTTKSLTPAMLVLHSLAAGLPKHSHKSFLILPAGLCVTENFLCLWQNVCFDQSLISIYLANVCSFRCGDRQLMPQPPSWPRLRIYKGNLLYIYDNWNKEICNFLFCTYVNYIKKLYARGFSNFCKIPCFCVLRGLAVKIFKNIFSHEQFSFTINNS